jgi:hypothetical protein
MLPISRRALLAGMAACGCSQLAGPRVWARSLSDAKGCVLLEGDYGLIAGRKISLGQTLSNAAAKDAGAGEKMRRTTNNPELDRALDRALKRLADTFGIFPGFGFYDDFDGPNARALRKDLVPKTKGTVLFGDKLFDNLMDLDGSGGAVMWTAAHEFAHIWLFYSGEMDKVRAGQKNVKRMELHADFLAGFYLGLRKKESPQVSLWTAGKDIWSSGDTQYNSPDHHGTPQERIAAAEAGFKVSFVEGRSAHDAFRAATDYVLSR